MKKLLIFGLPILSLIVLTGCGSDNHGNYDLKCKGDFALSVDVETPEDRYALSDDAEDLEEEPGFTLWNEESSGKGEYYFYFEDNKVYLEFEEEFNEEFTDKYYDDLKGAIDDFKQAKRDCTLDKKDNKAILKCKKFVLTGSYSEYNTKEKMKELMEKLEYKCE